MREYIEGAEFDSSHNRDKELQSLSPEQILDLAKKTLKIDLENTTKLLSKISSLSLSDKMADKELGMKLARFHEAFTKAKQREKDKQTPHHEEPPIDYQIAA